MKAFKLFFVCSVLLFSISCDKYTELDTLSDPNMNVEDRSPDYPSLDPGFSRGMGINNAGVLAGSTRDASGKVVAFRLSPNGLWLSDEEVKPNGLPEIRFSINDRGDVAGHKAVPGGIAPVVWKNGEAIDLAILPGYEFGEVYDINTSGVMVGECLNGNFISPSALRATVFTADGNVYDLGTFGGERASASGINDQGHIVGFADNTQGQGRAFLFKDGVMQNLGTLGGTFSNANEINNKGQIAGRTSLPNGAIRGFLYTDGQMINLGTLGGSASVAFDVNDKGEVVGFSRVPSGEAHAFLWKDGVMHDLGTLGGIDSRAISINNRSQIIGHYTLPGGSVHAFLWENGIMMPL